MKVIYLNQPLHPIIWIERQPNLFRVRAVRIYTGLPEEPPDDRLPITPPISDVLYVALAGHRFSTAPEQASAGLARYHRALIAQVQSPAIGPMTPEQALWLHQFNLSHKLIRDFGQYIQPWLGHCDPMKPGWPPHPHHDHRISLLHNIYELNEIRQN